MTTRVPENDSKLQERITALTEQVEAQPETWYKLLIERLVKQEMLIKELTKRLESLEKFENFHSAMLDSDLLTAPAFLRDCYEVRASHNLLPDEGFYNVERSGSGFEFRWTRQDFYFDVPVNRETEKKVQLALASAIKPELLEDIRCYADGTEIPLTKVDGAQGHVYEGILEKSKTVLRPTRISFHTKTSYSPRELDPESEDTRQLAVTFKHLIVE